MGQDFPRLRDHTMTTHREHTYSRYRHSHLINKDQSTALTFPLPHSHSHKQPQNTLKRKSSMEQQTQPQPAPYPTRRPLPEKQPRNPSSDSPSAVYSPQFPSQYPANHPPPQLSSLKAQYPTRQYASINAESDSVSHNQQTKHDDKRNR